MSQNIIFNDKFLNHRKVFKKFGYKADAIVIVSPFLTKNMSTFLKDFPTMTALEIYTNLDGYGLAGSIVDALWDAISYCKAGNIDLRIWHNNQLHGKAYLLYKEGKEAGFFISSSNYTENGLMNNYEFGVFIDNAEMQKDMRSRIDEINFSEITEEQVFLLREKASAFNKEHAAYQEPPKFKAGKYINIKPSTKSQSKCRYFLKPLGTAKSPVYIGYTIMNDKELGLSEKNKNISKGDIFICHGVGPSKILGYNQVVTDEPVYRKDFSDDRWPWKYSTECISNEFSSHWWDYELKTFELIEEFNLVKGEGVHATASGTDTIGSLQFGAQILEISKEFAEFIISKIPAM